jgi:outer membrane receptor protein involved in Fe transport
LTINCALAQTTGKIAGTVFDAQTNEPLAGANVVVENASMGASVAEDGSFFIINVPTGTYTISVQMIGYETVKIEHFRVSVNRTASIEIDLNPAILEGEVIVVQAEKIAVKKDQTSSSRNISSKNIEVLPVDNLNDVINLQTGVVKGHFRGGRSSEVSYMIDGMQVDEAFKREKTIVSIETEVVEDLEVITGTFNAEYGKAMSGIVNAVTKEGGNKFHVSLKIYGGHYLTSNKDIFTNLSDTDFGLRKDFRLFIQGPIFKNKLSYVFNGRYQDKGSSYNGIRRFEVDNFNDYLSTDPLSWYTEHTGDNKISKGTSEDISFFGKFTYKPSTNIRTSLTLTINDNNSRNYSHYYKYNPDGRPWANNRSQMIAFQFNHLLLKSAYHHFKVSLVKNYYGYYVYEDPNDDRYVSDFYSRSVAGYSTGGQSKSHIERWTENLNFKYDLTWQLHKNHSLKTGFQYTQHRLDNHDSTIRNKWEGTEEANLFEYDSLQQKRKYLYYEPVIMPDFSIYSDIYEVSPKEFSCYIQDKMEFELMVINLGLRYDYFDPNTVYPSQLRNPGNQLYFPLTDENGNIILDEAGNVIMDPTRTSTYPKADPKHQLSPRLGIAYQLGETAVLRFSYGHFFQMPPFYAIYQNHSFLLSPNDFGTEFGNANVHPQKTVQYEVGLWQQLRPDMSFEVAVFYRDIYDLLSAKVVTTYNQIRYGLYSNKDYGNVRGLEVKYDFFSEYLFASLNYTLQYTRGNADNPTFSFDRAGSNKDPVNKLIPMGWDQRHTLNISAGYNTPKFGATLVIHYDSGTPYTWQPRSISTLSLVNLIPNNSYKPHTIKVDFNGYFQLLNFGNSKLRFILLIYNLLDRLNENSVYSSSGSAFSRVDDESQKIHLRSDFFDYETAIKNPTMFYAPRELRIGLEYNF